MDGEKLGKQISRSKDSICGRVTHELTILSKLVFNFRVTLHDVRPNCSAAAKMQLLVRSVLAAHSGQMYIECLVEAPLIDNFLPDLRGDAYRHKGIWSADRPTYSIFQLDLPS
jgi:hypothetical protein